MQHHSSHFVSGIAGATRRVLEADLALAEEDRLLRALARQAARAALALWALEAMKSEILYPDPPKLLPPGTVALARTFRL